MWWITCLIWSTVYIFIKIGLNAVPPFTFAGMRLAVALVVLVPLMLWQGSRMPRGREWVLVGSTGFLLLGVNYGLLFWGARFISSGLTAVIQAITPAFGMLFASYFIPGERVTLRDVGAAAIGIAGIALIFRDQLRLAGPAALAGAATVAASAVCVALGYVLVKAYSRNLEPATITAGQMIFGGIPLLIVAAIREGNPVSANWTREAVIALLYLAIAGSVLAFWLNYWLLRRMSAASLLWMGIVEPVIAIVIGAIVLGETLSPLTAAGATAVLFSVALVLFKPRVAAVSIE